MSDQKHTVKSNKPKLSPLQKRVREVEKKRKVPISKSTHYDRKGSKK